MMEDLPHCVVQYCIPFGAAAQKDPVIAELCCHPLGRMPSWTSILTSNHRNQMSDFAEDKKIQWKIKLLRTSRSSSLLADFDHLSPIER